MSAIAGASVELLAMYGVCATLDRMAGDGPVLVESPASGIGIRAVWPDFGAWLVAGKSEQRNGGLVELCMYPPGREQLNILDTRLLSASGQPAERWREERTAFGVASAAFIDEYRNETQQFRDSRNELAEIYPQIASACAALESAANIAWTMYYDLRWIQVAAAFSVRYAGEAWGWRNAQGEVNRKSVESPLDMWRPLRDAGRQSFARRAAKFLLEMTARRSAWK